MRILGYALRIAGVALLLLLPTGCAKYPANSSGSNAAGPQVIVSMTVAGNLNPNDYYYVLFNNAGDPTGTSGPIPVVAAYQAGGNGFAAGAFTHYVLYHPPQPGGSNFGFYAISSDLLTSAYRGQPLQTQTGTNTIQFQLPLSSLATTAYPAGNISSLQINFLATNIVSNDPNYTGPKYFDALGQSNQPGGINDYITISTSGSRLYNDATAQNELAGDVTQYVNGTPQTVTQPDLDITNWSVEVRD